MDRIPTPSFEEYYKQYNYFLPRGVTGQTRDVWLPYESSRGGWWGEKHHCTFCGINGLGMKFREKSPDRVLAELRHLLAGHASNLITMYDTSCRTRTSKPSFGLPGTEMFSFIDEETARVALAGQRGKPGPAVDWALEHKAAVEIDNWIAPLATASPELIAKFEAQHRRPVRQEKRTPLGMAVGS
jgi:hypothetical protein